MYISSINTLQFGKKITFPTNINKTNLNTPKEKNETAKTNNTTQLSGTEKEKLIKDYERKIFELKERLSSSRNRDEYENYWIKIISYQNEINKLKKL